MEKEKQVQTNEVAKTTTTTTATAYAIEQYGEYIVLPTLYITREPYVSKNQNKQLWSYNVEVQFYGQTKKVGLQTPDSDEFGNFH